MVNESNRSRPPSETCEAVVADTDGKQSDCDRDNTGHRIHRNPEEFWVKAPGGFLRWPRRESK
ncbi:hypothetical protein [Nonomuraea typhae]|uniref:hypothetical protein n=1 Tax=Nonomuraea typhae TaxID=2603600 RepID=UPI0012FC4C3B|nr:hypothetical protein [Nonomuraea typhae]